MSGHSKWSKVKHQKAMTDPLKSQAFTKASRAITVAVKEGGAIADPDKNYRLRLAIDKAKSVNMPKDNIERAIAKGVASGGESLEQILYEGYGPSGVAVLVEAATDNRQRTSANIKHAFDRSGGSLASPGAVSFQFVRSGLLLIDRTPSLIFDTILEKAITAGADDVIERDDVYEIFTNGTAIKSVSDALREQGIMPSHTGLIMKPLVSVHVDDAVRPSIDTLIEVLEADEDVQEVFTNLA